MDFFHIIETAKIPQWKDKYIAAEKYETIIDNATTKQSQLAACDSLIDLLNEDCIDVNNFFVLSNSKIEKRYNYFINSFYKVFYKKIEKNENLKKILGENINNDSGKSKNKSVKIFSLEQKKSVRNIFESLALLFDSHTASRDLEDEKTDNSKDNQDQPNSLIIEHIYAQKAFEILLDIYTLNSFIEMNRSAVTVISNHADKSFLTRTFHENQEKITAQYNFFHDSTILSICKKIQTIYHIYSFLTDCSLLESKNMFLEYYDQNIFHDKQNIEQNMEQGSPTSDEESMDTAHNYSGEKIVSRINYHPFAKLAIFVIIISVLLNVKIFEDSAQTRGLALLTGCVFLWVSEAIELWVTAMLIPMLTVLFNVLKSNDGTILPASDASKMVFQSMFSSMIMVLLAGFSLSKALEKYSITKLLAEYIIHLCGQNPKKLLFGIMLLACFLSMWISNIAAPVLCYSLIKPILFSLPKKNFSATAFVLGIAFASNIGGMSSPIASPQNIITLEIMGEQQPDWGIWFVISIPVCLFSLLSVWLLLTFSCNFKDVVLENEKPKNESLNKIQIFICLVFLLTVGLWCVLTQTKQFFGSSGIVACIPIAILFGFKILTLEDLKSFHWNIIFLAMGANVLGLAMNNCKLLESLGNFLISKLHNVSFYGVFLISSLFVLAIASFVSHTISVIVLAPLIKQIGDSLSPPRSNILLISTALTASAAMLLPTSSFPNISAISLLNSNGDRYIYSWTFVKFGIISTCFCFCLIISLGFAIMLALGY